jgi:opacity protein-like surface antigen
MTRLNSKLFLIGALIAATVPAHAQDAATSPFYIGFGTGKSSASMENAASDWSMDVHAGYKLNENFAIEAFDRGISFRLPTPFLHDTQYYPDYHLGLAAIGSAQVADRVTAYGRLGIGSTNMKKSGNPDKRETDVTFGVGVSYAMTQHASLLLEATHFSNSAVTTGLVGVNYQF